VSGEAVVILEDMEGKNALPIWIGPAEAFAIELALKNVVPPRPMTHDLLKNTIESLNAKVTKVSITNLQNKTFYAMITLQFMDSEVNIDARPSDAIALALRVNVPIYAAESVVESAGSQKIIDIGRVARDMDETIH